MDKKKTLHILKNKTDRAPIDWIKHIESTQKIAILLIQDAVDMDLSPLKTQAFVLSEDLRTDTKTAHQKISYEEMLTMVFEYDAVISW